MTKQEILEHFKDINHAYNESTRFDDLSHMLDELMQSNSDEDKGEISDGCHTFNQLYHQRAVLFATIVNQNQDKAWKSYKHEDGQYCFDSNGEWFIVGIDTSEGSYTYHYSKKYWDLFKCKELPCGKHWDGHTEKDVTRLLSLEQEPKVDLDELKRRILMEVDGGTDDKWLKYCDVCDRISNSIDKYTAEKE